MELEQHEKYMRVALDHAAEALEKKEFPVGAVFVHKGEVVASGRREKSQEQTGVVNEIDHAEILGLRTLLTTAPEIAPAEVSVYSTMEPCLMCFATLLLNGIHHIVYAYEDMMGGGTNLSLTQLSPLYREMEVEIIPNVLRTESLGLFKQFFADPDNEYWKDSLLSSYTLSQ